jgi:hypothetical protein
MLLGCTAAAVCIVGRQLQPGMFAANSSTAAAVCATTLEGLQKTVHGRPKCKQCERKWAGTNMQSTVRPARHSRIQAFAAATLWLAASTAEYPLYCDADTTDDT